MVTAVSRALGVNEVKDVVKEAVELHKTFPDVVAGFDMVRIKLLITAKKIIYNYSKKF